MLHPNDVPDEVLDLMHLALFWHHHQPLYRDPITLEYVLPWAHYHAVKNYRQMAVLVEEAGLACTFNLVPSLLEQVLEYAEGSADDPLLRALEAEPTDLTDAELRHLERILPDRVEEGRIQTVAWRSLFSPVDAPPEDREGQRQLRNDILRDLWPHYRRLWESRVVDLTTSPYYHPLMPLLSDMSVAREEARPAVAFGHPEDVLHQLRKGRDYFKDVFGNHPSGLWPPEGALSAQVCQNAGQAGFSFAVTDENLLWKSLRVQGGPEDLARPYVCEGLTVFFRDRQISDLISFSYQKWNEQDAVSDIVRRLESKRDVLPDEAVLVLALDGENAWGYYRDNGVPFLRLLFDRLRSIKGVTPIALVEYLKTHPADRELALRPGTWLGSFAKWIGHPAKNAAWERLARARERCGSVEEILTAEASDWFWWYGEENTSEFDRLFRANLRKAYEKAGEKDPDA